MRKRGVLGNTSAVSPKGTLVFLILHGILVAAVMSGPAQASMRDRPCFGTREEWVAQRESVEKKLDESVKAEIDTLNTSSGLGSGIPTFSYPGAPGGGSDHPPGSVGDMQYRAGTWTHPHRPGASSRRDYERQRRELRDLDSYLRRCFPEEKGEEPEVEEPAGEDLAGAAETPCGFMLHPLFFGRCDNPAHKGRDCYRGPGWNE